MIWSQKDRLIALCAQLLLSLGGCASALSGDTKDGPPADPSAGGVGVPMVSKRCKEKTVPVQEDGSKFDVVALSPWMDIFWSVQGQQGANTASVTRCFNLGGGDQCWQMDANLRWKDDHKDFVAESLTGRAPITSITITGAISEGAGSTEGTVEERDDSGTVLVRAPLYARSAQAFFDRLERMQECNAQAMATVAK